MKILISIFAVIAWLAPATLEAQPRTLSTRDRIDGERTTRAFAEAVSGQKQSVAEIRRGDRLIALATIVSSDGLLLTKASELTGGFSVRLPDGREFESPLFEPAYGEDIALVKVPAQDLHPVRWGGSTNLTIGHWVSGFDTELNRVRIGIISAKRRTFKRTGGVMGVQMGTDGESVGGVEIVRVYPGSGADAVGIQRRDVVVSVDGKSVLERSELLEAVSAHDPGEKIKVTLRRDGEDIELEITLGDRLAVFDEFNNDLEFSGETSKRRSGFGEVIQHDIPLGSRAMGGPLFSLDGAVCGIQIARFDRVATFAIPSELAQSIIERLRPKLAAPAD